MQTYTEMQNLLWQICLSCTTVAEDYLNALRGPKSIVFVISFYFLRELRKLSHVMSDKATRRQYDHQSYFSLTREFWLLFSFCICKIFHIITLLYLLFWRFARVFLFVLSKTFFAYLCWFEYWIFLHSYIYNCLKFFLWTMPYVSPGCCFFFLLVTQIFKNFPFPLSQQSV